VDLVVADQNARQAVWAVYVSKICVTELDISRPSCDFLHPKRSETNFRGISSSIRPELAIPLASVHGLGRLRSFKGYTVLENAIISKFLSV